MVEITPNYKPTDWLKLDGVPVHFTYNVRQKLEICFPDKLVGRDGQQHVQLRLTLAPEITTLYIFLWEYLKN